VRLRCEVHDGVNVLRLEHVVDEVRGQDVALDEFVVGVVLDLVQILQARAVCRGVDREAIMSNGKVFECERMRVWRQCETHHSSMQ
jgi:hypothetical protein